MRLYAINILQFHYISKIIQNKKFRNKARQDKLRYMGLALLGSPQSSPGRESLNPIFLFPIWI